ncbi:hypothetical protein KM043_000930 [Ampulex compressa]|nr:hypothetical protein KM043_000930 [Ampulex compressa]
MASPTPSLESRANSLGSLASLSPLTVSGSSPPASDSAICDVDSCDLCLDAQKPGEAPCPRCRLGGASGVHCTGCKSTESDAVARCFDCANFLCPNCVMAHQFMHCFEGHRVLNLADSKLETVSSSATTEMPKSNLVINGAGNNGEKVLFCPRHKQELLKYFCRSCTVPVCKECTISDHPGPLHDCGHISDVGSQQLEALARVVQECRAKAADVRAAIKAADHGAARLQVQYHKAQNEINDTFQFYRSMLEERKQELLKELESVFSTKQISLGVQTQKANETADKILQTCEFVERLTKYTTVTEVLMVKKLLDTKLQLLLNYTPDISGQSVDLDVIAKRFSSANSLGPFSTSISDLALNGMNGNPYEKWSNGGSEGYPVVTSNDHFPMPTAVAVAAAANASPGDSVIDLTSKLMSAAAIFPPKSQIKRQKMIYHCKFGEFGVMEGQFTEPSGVAVNAQNDIIVADTNNHRIQIFDKEGRFKFQFGECGKRDGQLLYPNRVAVVKTSGDIIVTERSPTHQIQIYNQYGQFVRKFGANILQHPRGVTVDSKGRIVVVECKVMRVIIFDQAGNVLQKFGCSKHLEFPNGVVVNDKQEIFISDNRAHCVKVFNYEGAYLRQIGGEGITNYPIGVGINVVGEILIADNHNNFNLTIFTQDGQLVSALESKVKHAQCFDVALMDDGSVVLASKDYRLYIYRYVQVPPIGM